MADTIDTLELKIESDAQQASDGIERLADKLIKLGTATESGQSDLGKFANAIHEFAKSIKGLDGTDNVAKSMGEISKITEKISKTPLKFSADDMEVALDKLREQFKDVGTDFKFTGSAKEIEKEIENTSAQLDKLYAKEDKVKAIGGNVESSGIKSLIYDIQLLTNKLDILRNMQESVSKQDIISPTIQTMADESKQSLEGFVQEIQHYKDILKAGGIETDMGKNMSIAISGAQITLGQLIEEFPQATKEISELQSVIDQMQNSKPFSGIEGGTRNIENEVEEIRNKFGEVSKAIKLSSLSSEDFQNRLNELYVPTSLEDNLGKLQSKLKSVEEQEQKLIYQQEKGLVLGTIEFDSDAYRNLEVKIKETQLTAEMLREKIAQVTSDIEKESAEAAKAWKENLGNLKIPNITETDPKKLTSSLKKLESDLQKAKSNLQNDITMGRIVVDDSGYQKAIEKITLIEKTIDATKNRMKQLGVPATGIEQTGKSMSSAQAMANLFSKAISTLVSKLEQLGKKAINFAVNGLKKFGDGIKKAISGIKKLISSIVKFAKENKKSNSSIGVSFKTILKYVFGIRSLYMLVRKMKAAFKEGTDNLVQYSGEVNHSVSIMTSALGALKNALAVAFAPIVNVVAPYITKFINMMTDAFNAVGRFFAALTGKKIATQATKFYKDYADSIAGVGDAAKDADKALHTLGIDELNIINENKEDKGGGGVDVEDMFTDVAIEGAINDWARKIREAFLAGNWEELGKTIAEMMNAGLQKVYDAIVDITPKVEQALKNFAKVFNAWVEYFDWELLGRTIGAGINLLVKAFNALTGDEGINFERLGNKLSVGFRGMVDEINWRELGNALGNGFMVAWRILEGFIDDMWRVSEQTLLTGWAELGIAFAEGVHGIFERVNFGSIGKTLADGFNGIFEIINNFNKRMSDNGTWQEIANNISNGLNNAIKGIRPIEAAQALGKFVTDLLGTMLEVAEKTPWHDLGTKIGQFLENIPWLTIFKQVTSTITTVVGGLFSGLAEEILNNAEKIGAGIADAINFIFSKLDGITDWISNSGLGIKISNGLNAMIDGINWKENGKKLNDLITAFLNEIFIAAKNIKWDDLGRGIGESLSQIQWNQHFKTIFDIITNVLGGLIDGLKETTVGKITLAVGGGIAAFKGFEKLTPIFEAIFGPSGKLYATLAAGLAGFVTAIAIGGKDLANSANELIHNILDWLIDAVKNMDWGEVWRNIIEFLGNFDYLGITGKVIALGIELIGHLFAGLIEGVLTADWIEIGENLIKGLVVGVKSWIDALLDIPKMIFDAIVNGIKGLFGIKSPSTVMAEIGGFIMQGLINGITALKDGVITIFSGIKDTIVNIWNGIGDFFSGLWEGIRNTAETAWNGISGFLSSAWQGISSTASSIWGGIKSFFGSVWDGISSTAQSVWNGITGFLSGVWQGIQNTASSVWGTIKNVIGNAFEGVSAAFSTVWSEIKTFLSTTWEGIKTTASNIWSGIKTTIGSAWNGLKENAETVWGNIKTTIGGTWDTLKEWSSSKFEAVKTNISSVWEKVSTSTKDTWNGVKSFVGERIPEIVNDVQERFSGLPTFMTDNGKNIINGLMNGINEKTSALREKVTEVAGNVSGWFKEKLGIHSPSTVFADIAGYTFQGFVNGADSKQNTVRDKMLEIAQGAINAFDGIDGEFDTIGTGMMTSMDEAILAQRDIVPNQMKKMAESIKDAFSGLADHFNSIGVNAMQGMVRGLNSSDVIGVASNLANMVSNTFRNVLGIHSPSTVFEEIGENTMRGYENGIDAGKNRILSKMEGAVSDSIKPFANIGAEIAKYIKEGIYSIPYGQIASEAMDLIMRSFDNSLGKLRNVISSHMERIADLIQYFSNVLGNYFLQMGGNMMDSLNGNLMSRIDRIKSKLEEFALNIKSMFSNVFSGLSFNIPNFSSYSIPAFATGGSAENGLIFANSMELAEKFPNGKNAFSNNEQIIAGIEEAAYRGFLRAQAETPYLQEIADNTRRSAEKDPKLVLEGRETVSWMRQWDSRMGYNMGG